MGDNLTPILSYLRADLLPAEDRKLLLDEVESTLKKVALATIVENLLPADRKVFIAFIATAAKDPDDGKWLEFARSKIAHLDSILETAYMDALQRIKLGI